jgi:hypothetical protein
LTMNKHTMVRNLDLATKFYSFQKELYRKISVLQNC